MDPLGDLLTTRRIQTGWEFTMEPYPSRRFGIIDDPDRQFGNGSVWTRTRTRSDGLEPLLILVGTEVTGPRTRFAIDLALMKTASEDEAYGVANTIADKGLQFLVRLSDAATVATTRSLADTERVTYQLEREIYGITSNGQKQFKTEFSIRLIKFEAWWESIGIQAHRNTIEQRVIHFGYPKMHLVSHISESIRRMGSSDNYTTDISERLHITNVKGAYRSSNKVIYIRLLGVLS